MASLGDLVVRIGADTKNLNQELGKVQRTMKSMTGNLTALGQNMTRSITLPLAGMGAAALKSAADMETLETSFISLTGGAEQASRMMKQLTDFTAKTPFQIDAVAKSARQLIASGTDVSQVNDQLQFLGDIAATSGSSIDEIAAIFSKVQAKGKVELESLNQLAERGVPIFKALAEATGLPADKLGAGAVSVEQFNEVLKGFAGQGGFAEGAMERLSQTVSGKFSTALDNAKLAAASLGEQLLPIASQILDTFTNLAQEFTQLDAGTKRIAIGIGAVTASFGPMLTVLPKILAGLTALTSPIGLAITAIAALTAAIMYFWDDIRPVLTQVINVFIQLYNNIVPLRVIIAVLKTAFVNAGKAIYTAFNAVLDTFSTLLQSLSKLLEGDFSGAFDSLTQGLAAVGTDIFNVASDIGTDMVDAINSAIYAEPIDLLGEDALPTKAEIMARFHNLFTGVGESVGTTVGEDMVKGFLKSLDAMSSSPSLKKAQHSITDFSVKAVEATENVNHAMSRMVDVFATSVGQQIENAQNLKQAIVSVAKSLIMARLAEAKANVVSGASSFAASMGPAAPFVIGGALATMMALINRIDIPALAKGGVAFGPSLAMVGDNPNARIDPEVIAPLSKLRDMMGGQQIEVYGRISGNDIYISNQRTSTRRERYT
jgi:tape measure domain-containing protein